MRKKIKSSCAFLCSCLVLFSTVSCSGGEENLPVGEMTVKTPLTSEKIMLDGDLTGLDEDGIEIFGAKGEADSGQFVVRPTENVTSYDVTITDFKSGANTISATQVEICKQVYTYCSLGRYTGDLKSGYYPDAIIPIEYIQAEGEDKIKAGENQGFWLNVRVPQDAVAGDYTATVTLTYNKTGKITVPVKLTVYDFVIDALPYITAGTPIYKDWLHYGELTDSNEMFNTYMDVLVEYNCQPTTLGGREVEEHINFLREYYDRLTVFRIPYKSHSNTENDWGFLEAMLERMIEVSIEDGINYFEKAFYRFDLFYDEYNDVAWRKPLIRPLIAGCDELEERLVQKYVNEGKLQADDPIATCLLGLRHGITNTKGWDEEFADIFNMYIVSFGGLHYTSVLEEFTSLQKNNDLLLWGYGCIGTGDYPEPGLEINDYLPSLREAMWLDYQYDIEGFYTWNVNGYCNWLYYTPFGWAIIDDLYTTAAHEGLSSGDGYLLYPGAPYGSPKPFGSVRMATIRDGVDDHTYMSQLGGMYQAMQGYGEDYAVENAKGLVNFLNERLLGRYASKLDYTGALECKNILATAICMAEKNGFVVDKLQTVDNTIEYSFYAKSGVEVILNGQKLTGTVSGEGIHYEGELTIPADRKLVLSVQGQEASGTMNLLTPPQKVTVSEFETASDVSKTFLVASRDKVELNTAVSYAVFGNSAKITLNGRADSDTIIKSYTPTFQIPMEKLGGKLTELYSIEFEIYNASSEDIEVMVYFERTSEQGVSVTSDYDKIVLKAGEWRKVVLDNFNLVSADPEILDKVEYLGVKCNNLLDSKNRPYSASFYMDNLAVRKK